MHKDRIEQVESMLRAKLVAKLNVRWSKSGAHLPEGGSRVHTAAPLDPEEERDFDMYVIAYQDAIADFVAMLDPEIDAQIQATRGLPGYVVKEMDKSSRPRIRDSRRKPGKPKSEARRKAEGLFKGGANEV